MEHYARFRALTTDEYSQLCWRHVSRLLDAMGFVVGPKTHDGFLWFFYRGDSQYPLPLAISPFTEATFEWTDISVRLLMRHCYDIIDRYGVEQPEPVVEPQEEVW